MNRWDAVLGQEELAAAWRTERARGRTAHAYLFEGAPGTGRAGVARAWAADLLCAAPGDHGACGACENCRLLDSGHHPDYLELPREPRELRLARLVAREGGTERIDHPPALEFLHLTPVLAARRVLVIPDAERLRADAANAFLKTLEEPPGASAIALTVAARERLLPTIVSRCRRWSVRPLAADALAGELVRRGAADKDAAELLARAAEGSLGTALELAGGRTVDDWRWLAAALDDLTPTGSAALAAGWVERAAGADAAARRAGALRQLDLAALALRRRWREGAPPLAVEEALRALWKGGELIGQNVKVELALATTAVEVVAALRPPARRERG